MSECTKRLRGAVSDPVGAVHQKVYRADDVEEPDQRQGPGSASPQNDEHQQRQHTRDHVAVGGRSCESAWQRPRNDSGGKKYQVPGSEMHVAGLAKRKD